MLTSMIEASEIAVENYLQQPIDTFVFENKLNAALKHAIKIMVGNFYANRESVAYTNPKPVPYTLEFLLKPYRKYTLDSQGRRDSYLVTLRKINS
jgi:hypothetical protein